MRRTIVGAAAALMMSALAAPALAASVSDCGDVSRLENVVEPWEGSTKTFYGGKMRVVLVDTGGEPACCSTYLAVLYTVEPNDEPPYTACKLIKDKTSCLYYMPEDPKGIPLTAQIVDLAGNRTIASIQKGGKK